MGNHMLEHMDSDCPLCRDEALITLNDLQAVANLDQELDEQEG